MWKWRKAPRQRVNAVSGSHVPLSKLAREREGEIWVAAVCTVAAGEERSAATRQHRAPLMWCGELAQRSAGKLGGARNKYQLSGSFRAPAALAFTLTQINSAASGQRCSQHGELKDEEYMELDWTKVKRARVRDQAHLMWKSLEGICLASR